MQDAQRHHSTRSSAPPAAAGRSHHRHVARLVGVCVFLGVLLFAVSLSAQKVLMAPQTDVSFDSISVSGPADALQVDYTLSEGDWQWTQDFGMDVFLGLYTAQGNRGNQGNTGNQGDAWQLERVEQVGARDGEVSFGAGAGADRVGLCVIAASIDGGKLAPGMGYVCEEPLVVQTAGASADFDQSEASVALRFEQNVDQQPWYTAQRGFARAGSAEQQTAEQGEFFTHRAPTPEGLQQQMRDQRRERQQRAHSQRRASRSAPQDGRRGDLPHGYPSQNHLLLTPGYLPGLFDRGDRFTTDRFRQRRLRQRRMFGPLDGFDAKFDQHMFGAHPEDVFRSFPVPPGHFGRDAFGRDLSHGFGAPPNLHHRLRMRMRGLGVPFR